MRVSEQAMAELLQTQSAKRDGFNWGQILIALVAVSIVLGMGVHIFR